jgi:metallo-beta-lactamase class B
MSLKTIGGSCWPPLMISALLPLSLAAQAPQDAPAKPDSPEAASHVAKAKKIGGTEWAGEEHFFCEAPRATDANAPMIEPTKIFDNVYAIGRAATTEYAITTPDGIILIDSGYTRDVETILLPAFQKLGLDPKQIKYSIITHGHADHFGGAFYLQEHFGTRIAMSAEDWDVVLAPPPADAKKKGEPQPLPRKDMILAEGQPVTLGGEKLTPVFIPGHTPGSMGLIFPVKDGGKTHVAALFGGTILVAGRIPDAGLQEYLRSIAHFKQMAKEMKVDVELQNHPVYDNMPENLVQIGSRKTGMPNPFVVGPDNYAKFLDVMDECMRADIARRVQ